MRTCDLPAIALNWLINWRRCTLRACPPSSQYSVASSGIRLFHTSICRLRAAPEIVEVYEVFAEFPECSEDRFYRLRLFCDRPSLAAIRKNRMTANEQNMKIASSIRTEYAFNCYFQINVLTQKETRVTACYYFRNNHTFREFSPVF